MDSVSLGMDSVSQREGVGCGVWVEFVVDPVSTVGCGCQLWGVSGFCARMGTIPWRTTKRGEPHTIDWGNSNVCNAHASATIYLEVGTDR